MKYADEVSAQFGIPWMEGLSYERGGLKSGLDASEAALMLANEPKKAKLLMEVLENQASQEEEDPIQWGFSLPSWQRVMDRWDKDKVHVIFGGNRSSKTTFASRLLVHLAQVIPEAELRSFHVTEDRSIEDTQKFVWDAIPKRYKEMKKRSATHSLTYTHKNGFTDGKVIFPPQEGYKRGSYLRFNNYRQFLQDSQIIEGMTAHCIHLEEECPAKLFETLLARVADYHGRIIMTFTTSQGWTDLVSSLLRGAKTVETRYSEYLGMDLPIEQESANWEGCRIHYFWSEDNPFFDSKELRKAYSKQPLEVKQARLYGVPSKVFQNRFPKFNPHVNVVKHGDMPFIEDPTEKVTRYMICDPAGSKPWVMIWVAVDEEGCWWVYREWPDSTVGSWSLPHANSQGKSIGKPGPGQRPVGYGYEDYANLMKDLEQDEEIFERLVDPRFGKATVRTGMGETNMINEMMDYDIFLRPAPGLEIEHGIQKINDLLSWDDTQPMDDENCPSMFISERCDNLIYAMTEYTGCSRQEQTKDFIDVLRYGAVTPLDHVGESQLAVAGGGGY